MSFLLACKTFGNKRAQHSLLSSSSQANNLLKHYKYRSWGSLPNHHFHRIPKINDLLSIIVSKISIIVLSASKIEIKSEIVHILAWRLFFGKKNMKNNPKEIRTLITIQRNTIWQDTISPTPIAISWHKVVNDRMTDKSIQGIRNYIV